MLCLSLVVQGFGGRRIFSAQCCRHNRVQIVHVEGVFAQQLRASGCVSLLVSCAEVLTHEGSVAIGEIAVVDLLGVVWDGVSRGSELVARESSCRALDQMAEVYRQSTQASKESSHSRFNWWR